MTHCFTSPAQFIELSRLELLSVIGLRLFRFLLSRVEVSPELSFKCIYVSCVDSDYPDRRSLLCDTFDFFPFIIAPSAFAMKLQTSAFFFPSAFRNRYLSISANSALVGGAASFYILYRLSFESRWRSLPLIRFCKRFTLETFAFPPPPPLFMVSSSGEIKVAPSSGIYSSFPG